MGLNNGSEAHQTGSETPSTTTILKDNNEDDLHRHEFGLALRALLNRKNGVTFNLEVTGSSVDLMRWLWSV